ncbi:MAG: hypothetical protein K6F53_04785 [Lachnospiraceae bacterium]|nr:hypothetical protein [Lachnospiraceae bacterium]
MKKVLTTLLSLGLIVMIAAGLGPNAYAKPNDAYLDSFDAEFYAAAYPDVVAALGSTEQALYGHYVKFGKAEGRFPNAQAAIAAAAKTTQGNAKTPAATPTPAPAKAASPNAAFFAPEDVNYLRAAYLAHWGSYEIGKKDEWGEGDPAVGFTRQDYTQLPIYQDTKADILNAVGKRTDYIVVHLPHSFIVNNQADHAYYTNIAKNLLIDMMKSGQIINAQLWIATSDGELHLNTYGLPHSYILLANDRALDKADIAAHPEIKGYYNKGCLSGE